METIREGQIETKIAEAKRDGFCILKNHIPREILQAWTHAFAPLLAKQAEIEGKLTSRGPNRYYVTLPFQAPFADPAIFENDTVLAIVEGLVGKDPVLCQLASDTPVEGSDFQPIHRDTFPLFPEITPETPAFQLAVNFPLVDVTLENGPLEVVRGTHLMTREEGLRRLESGEAKIEPCLMNVGDVMIRDVRGLHRGTPNRTSIPRPMVVLGYSRSWLNRPEVSIRVPRTILPQLSDRAKKLLRYNPIVDSLEETAAPESYQVFSY